MKIKEVCERTGLTDRAVRHYIEEKLIAPEYSENYLGRKTFYFTEADVRTLLDIAVLRRIGFSVPDIRAIENDPNSSTARIDALRKQKQNMISTEQACLDALNTLENRSYSLEDLASALRQSAAKKPLPNEDSRVTAKTVLKRISLILWNTVRFILTAFFLLVPFSWLLHNMYSRWNGQYLYPHLIDSHYVVFLTLLPSLLILLVLIIDHVFALLKGKFKVIVYIVAFVVCTGLMLFSFIGYVFAETESLTTDITDYRNLDRDCAAEGDPFYEALFPADPYDYEYLQETEGNGAQEARASDSAYRYRWYIRGGGHVRRWGKQFFSYGDAINSVYAEWELSPDRFDAEVSRVTALFAADTASEGEYRTETVEKNGWVIMLRYRGDGPFAEETNLTYRYYVFACRAEDRRVRYLFCDCTNYDAPYPGQDEEPYEQPFYLELDW